MPRCLSSTRRTPQPLSPTYSEGAPGRAPHAQSSSLLGARSCLHGSARLSRLRAVCRERVPGHPRRRRPAAAVRWRQFARGSRVAAHDVSHCSKRRHHALRPARVEAGDSVRIQRRHDPTGPATTRRARLHRTCAHRRRTSLDALARSGRQARPGRRRTTRTGRGARACKRCRETTAQAASLATAELASTFLPCCHQNLRRTRRRRRNPQRRLAAVPAVSSSTSAAVEPADGAVTSRARSGP